MALPRPPAGANRRWRSWHDPAMPIVERMKLADGRPLPRRMMAAMAQQDCGQCGYNCNDYAERAVRKIREAAEPLRAGRQRNFPHAQQLYTELDGATTEAPAPPLQPAARPAAPALGRSRDNPSSATFLSRRGSTNKARKKRPGTSISILPVPTRLRCRRFVRHFSEPTISLWSMPCWRQSTRRRIFPFLTVRCAPCSPTALRCRRRPTSCSS